MTKLPIVADYDSGQLGAALLAHLDTQLRSADRILELVLEQVRAIRARDVHRVLEIVGYLQVEAEARAALESDRVALLTAAGNVLGVHGNAITLEAFCSLLDPATAAAVTSRSNQLKGVLREVRDEHLVARALMRQELAFVDRLVRVLGATDDTATGAYSRVTGPLLGSTAPFAPTHPLLDLQA
ncbi:MAG: flagellar export chaperone FlgN [Patulibacter sp.]